MSPSLNSQAVRSVKAGAARTRSSKYSCRAASAPAVGWRVRALHACGPRRWNGLRRERRRRHDLRTDALQRAPENVNVAAARRLRRPRPSRRRT